LALRNTDRKCFPPSAFAAQPMMQAERRLVLAGCGWCNRSHVRADAKLAWLVNYRPLSSSPHWEWATAAGASGRGNGDEAAPGDKAPALVQSGAYDQAFFLALAAKGKDAWNAWRHVPVNKDLPVTFAEIYFSEAPKDKIDFSGFEFGDNADFSVCKWRDIEWKEIQGDVQAFKPGRAHFVSSKFGRLAKFIGAVFGSSAEKPVSKSRAARSRAGTPKLSGPGEAKQTGRSPGRSFAGGSGNRRGDIDEQGGVD
jgi:hypothetical protein